LIFRNIIKLHVQITFLNSDTLLSEQKKYEKYVYFYELSRIPSTRLSHLYILSDIMMRDIMMRDIMMRDIMRIYDT
jgi:hypothetical protein